MNVISIRCIIFRRRNLDCIAVFKRINRLHNAFSEGLYPDERSVIIILDCSGKNLRSTRTVLIDKDSDRKLKTIAVRSIVLALAILIFRINNRALRQNLIQDEQILSTYGIGNGSNHSGYCFFFVPEDTDRITLYAEQKKTVEKIQVIDTLYIKEMKVLPEDEGLTEELVEAKSGSSAAKLVGVYIGKQAFQVADD